MNFSLVISIDYVDIRYKNILFFQIYSFSRVAMQIFPSIITTSYIHGILTLDFGYSIQPGQVNYSKNFLEKLKLTFIFYKFFILI